MRGSGTQNGAALHGGAVPKSEPGGSGPSLSILRPSERPGEGSPMAEPQQDWKITVAEAARILGLNRTRTYELLKARVLPAVRLQGGGERGDYLLHRAEIQEFMRRGRPGLWDGAQTAPVSEPDNQHLVADVVDELLEALVSVRRGTRRA